MYCEYSMRSCTKVQGMLRSAFSQPRSPFRLCRFRPPEFLSTIRAGILGVEACTCGRHPGGREGWFRDLLPTNSTMHRRAQTSTWNRRKEPATLILAGGQKRRRLRHRWEGNCSGCLLHSSCLHRSPHCKKENSDTN